MLSQPVPSSPVVSAINPLFQPAVIPRQPSNLVQKTLSNISLQLSALEDSLQHDASATATSNTTSGLSSTSQATAGNAAASATAPEVSGADTAGMQTKGLDCAKQLPHCVQLDKAANQIGMLANTDDTPQAEPLPLDRIAAGQASLTRDQIAEGPGVNDEIAKPSSNSTPAPSAATDVGTQQHQHTAASDVVRAAPPVALRQVSVAQAVADAAIATAALSVSVSDTEGNGGFSQQLNAQQSLNKSSSQSCQQFGVQSSLDVAPSMSPHASRAAETAGTSQQLAPQQSFSTAAANAAQQLIHQSSQPKAPPENSNVHSRTSSLASPWLLQQALDATVNLAEEGQHLLQYTEGKPFAAPRPLDVTEADEEIAATAGAAAASTHAVPATAQAVSTVAAPAVTEAALAYTAAAVATDPSSDEKGDTAPADAGLITQTKAAASDSPTFSVPRRHDASLEQMLEGPGSIADDADASVAVLPDGMPPAASHLPMHHELAANSPAHSVHSTSVNTDAASLDPMPTATSLSPTNSQGPAHFPSHDPESTADHTDCSSESVPILRSAYTPPPPQDSKHRFSGPRRSAAFRHSISGNDQSRQLATSLAAWPNPDSHRESQSMQDGVARRPQTAIPSHGASQDFLLGHEQMRASLGLPVSPVRDRMKHAVHRESVLRLEAEMAALDLDDLLQQRAAAESQAQAEAARNADLQEELLQVREELRRARMEGSRQRARELQWELKAAQLTAAGLQEQLLESQKELDIMREQCFAAETAKAAAMQQQKAAGLLHSKPASPNKESLLFAEVQHLHQQVAELHGRLQQAQGDNARLLSMRRPSNPGSKAADTCSNSNHSETVSEDSNAASARHIQRSNSSQSEACASEPEAQVQHSDRGPDLNIRDAADVSVLLSGELCKWLQKVADSLTADAAKLATASQQQPEPGTAHDEGKAFNWGFPVSQTSPVRDRSGPVRPATAAPADGGKQRPRRQWSAQHAMQPDEGSQGMERPERARPLTAVEDIHQRPASARNTHRHLHVDVEYYDSVPPTRMREEVLQQAREDYIREKNRVREKRLQELTLNRTTAELTTDT